jgi:hypothetical protein
MAVLAGAVITIAELKGVAESADISVRKVALGHKKAGRTSVVITALRALKNSNGPLLINTPLKYIVADDAEDDASDEQLDKDLALKVELLCAEARAFIVDGKRAQGDLFRQQEPKPNARRPRAEDGYQTDQPELEMAPIGETVAAVAETLGGDLAAAFDGPGVANLQEGQAAALDKVQTWLDYKEWCFSFGQRVNRKFFNDLIASRDPSEVRPGYRDPQAAAEREMRRRAARTVLANAGVASDDDLQIG